MELYDYGTRIFCLIILFIYYVTGVVGNALTIWTILRQKYLRSIQNIIVALLAVIDLLVIGCVLPMNMKVLISNTKPGFEHCRLNAIVFCFLWILSMEFVMLISVSRYVKICHSPKFNTVFTARNLTFAVLLFCVIDAMFASLFWFDEDWWTFDKPCHTCVWNRYRSPDISIAVTATTVGIPFTVTVFCYLRIYCKVMQARKNLQSHWNNGLTRRRFAYENMVTKTQFAVFAFYIVLYFPAGITTYGQRSDFPDAFHTVSFYLCYLNSCINCFLYGFLNKEMRKGYIESLSCLKGTISKQNRVAPSISGIVKPTMSTQTSHL